MSRWDGEDLKPGHDPDQDPHPEIPDFTDDEPPGQAKGRKHAHPDQPGKPDRDADDAAGDD